MQEHSFQKFQENRFNLLEISSLESVLYIVSWFGSFRSNLRKTFASNFFQSALSVQQTDARVKINTCAHCSLCHIVP
jgi:hypothetical protein